MTKIYKAPKTSKAPKPSKARAVPKAGNPYPTPTWPSLPGPNQVQVCNLLSELISPIGEWSLSITTSKGKRAKRKRDEIVPKSTPLPKPLILQYLTIGLNSTTRQLTEHQSESGKDDESKQSENRDDPLEVVFITHPFVSLQYAHLPLLASLAHPTVKLVQLQNGSEEILCKALNLPRIGMLGVRGKMPGFESVSELLKDLPIVQAPNLKNFAGQWMGTKIEI